MRLASRPLRALGLVLGGWTAARIVALWPVSGIAIEPRSFDAALAAPTKASGMATRHDDVALFAGRNLAERAETKLLTAGRSATAARFSAPGVIESARSDVGTVAQLPVAPMPASRPPNGAPGLPAVVSKNRLSGSGWALMRGNGAQSLANGGQLGGSQTGMRLFYTPGPGALALTARVSAPLSQPQGREAALGVAIRGRNAGLIAEHRISLDKGGRNAPAVFGYGGFSDLKVSADTKFDGYVQAGVVGIKEPAAFIDGAVRLEHEIVKAKSTSLAVGAGAWGGAQKGAARIDIGPQIVARLAVAQTAFRVSAEWRQRIVGNAAPASGPSVTVGFDF